MPETLMDDRSCVTEA